MSQLALGFLICTLHTTSYRPLNCPCPPNSGLKPCDEKEKHPWPLLMTACTQGELVAVCSSPCFPQGLHFHKRWKEPVWLAVPATCHILASFPSLACVSYIWRLGMQMGSADLHLVLLCMSGSGKREETRSFSCCFAYSYFRDLTAELQVFQEWKMSSQLWEHKLFTVALNTGRLKTYSQDVQQQPAGWDDVQGGGKEGKKWGRELLCTSWEVSLLWLVSLCESNCFSILQLSLVVFNFSVYWYISKLMSQQSFDPCESLQLKPI